MQFRIVKELALLFFSIDIDFALLCKVFSVQAASAIQLAYHIAQRNILYAHHHVTFCNRKLAIIDILISI